MTGADLAAAAAALVGTRFRLNGRDPATGLDCIGLLEAALNAQGGTARLPVGYTLRTNQPERWIGDAARFGLVAAQGPVQPGDVLLIEVSAGQLHLTIAGSAERTWIHAHAGLRRIVIAPQRPDGAILHHWRLRPQS